LGSVPPTRRDVGPRLDAEGSRIVKAIAQAMIDFDNWDPVDPYYQNFGRVEGAEQYAAFRVVYDKKPKELTPAPGGL